MFGKSSQRREWGMTYFRCLCPVDLADLSWITTVSRCSQSFSQPSLKNRHAGSLMGKMLFQIWRLFWRRLQEQGSDPLDNFLKAIFGCWKRLKAWPFKVAEGNLVSAWDKVWSDSLIISMKPSRTDCAAVNRKRVEQNGCNSEVRVRP